MILSAKQQKETNCAVRIAISKEGHFVDITKNDAHIFGISFYFFILSTKDASTASCLDFLFRQLGEVLCLDNYGYIDLAISQELEVSLGDEVNHRGLSCSGLCCFINILKPLWLKGFTSRLDAI